MPNWLNGIVTWAKGNKAYAVAIVGGVLVMAWFLFVPGEDPQVVQQQQAEDRFGAGALAGRRDDGEGADGNAGGG